MAITSLAVFMDYLADLSVTGVVVNRGNALIGPPDNVQSADLPMKWVTLPFSNEGPLTFSGEGGWPTLSGQVVIAMESVNLNTPEARVDAYITMVDNLDTALRAGSVTKTKMSWTTALETVFIGKDAAEYLALIATVTGAG